MKELEKEFNDIYRQIGQSMGQDDITATIFTTLYIEPEDIAMDELAKKTGYSLASISNKIKLFESMGMLMRKKKPGSKKIYLYMEKDMIKVIKKTLLAKENRGMEVLKEKLPELVKKYKDKAKTERDKKKIKIIEDYNVQVIKIEKIMQKIRKEFEEA